MIVFFPRSLCVVPKKRRWKFWESSDDETIKVFYKKQFFELTNLHQRDSLTSLREEIDVTHFCLHMFWRFYGGLATDTGDWRRSGLFINLLNYDSYSVASRELWFVVDKNQ